MIDADSATVRAYPTRRPQAPDRIIINSLVSARRTINWLAEHCGMPAHDMACIVSGEAPLSEDMARRIAAAFGDDPAAWVRALQDWRAWRRMPATPAGPDSLDDPIE